MRELLISPPTHEPVSLSEVKDYLKLNTDVEDALLANLIQVARESCEQFTKRALITQSWALLTKCAPSIPLRRDPVQNIIQVFHVKDGESVPLSSSTYDLDDTSLGTHVVLRQAPPYGGDLRIEYQAGYGNDWNTVPTALRQGVLRLIAHMHRFRDDGEQDGIPLAVCALWRPYRVQRL